MAEPGYDFSGPMGPTVCTTAAALAYVETLKFPSVCVEVCNELSNFNTICPLGFGVL